MVLGIRTWGVLPLFWLGLPYGQADLATVTGVVTDTARAVIPGVTVYLRNTETGANLKEVTNQEGYFTFSELPPGPYELNAASQGFSNYRESGITLETSQTLRIEIKLQIGSVNETINVTANAAVLNTDNGTVKGDVLVSAEIQDMPLNGRDFTELALIVPGVVTNAQGGAGGFAAINGARADGINFVINGFDDKDVRGGGAQMRPNVDALQEFKMETTGYSAEYGKMAGGVLNMVVRSGTNQVHGSLFEYFRNDVFDARAFFSPSRLALHQNQFGGLIAGPLSVPKVYNGRNRTFYMLSWESFRLGWGENKFGNVPSVLERAGNFSQDLSNTGKVITVKNPFSNNVAFPGNIIPASLFSPIGVKLTQYYPLPNRNNFANNYQSFANNISEWDSFVVRIDERVSDKDSFSMNYNTRYNRSNAPWAGSNLGIFQDDVHSHPELGGLSYTRIFTPALIMEVRAGLSRNVDNEAMINKEFPTAAQLGMQGSTSDPALAGFPLINVTNYLALGFANNMPLEFAVTDLQAGGKFTWIKGGHILKWGADVARNRFNQPYYNNSRGSMTASNSWTGDAYGDILVGLLNASSLTQQVNRNYMRETNYGLFFNDDWKATRSLTLNLGLRYDLALPVSDRYGRMSNFLPGLDKIIVSDPGSVPNYNQLVAQSGLSKLVGTASQYGLPKALEYTDYLVFAPRAGFAWRPFSANRMVIRGGYGIYYTGNELNDLRNAIENTFPFAILQNFARVAADVKSLTLENPWNQALATLGGTTTSNGIELHAPRGYLQSYNMTIEREIGKGVVFEAGYVGSRGTHLSRQYNINQPVRSIPYYMAYGTSFPVLYPPLGTITYFGFGANSSYNAGQFTLRKRAGGSIFYSVNYTYSKSIDDSSQFAGASTGGFGQAADARNLSLERARSDWDRGHIFSAVFSWQLPVGRGKPWLSHTNKLVDGVAGGWQLAGNMTFQSGPPFTVEDSSINANTGQSTRPNRIASGFDPAGTGKRGVDYPWFSPGAFVATPTCASRTNCSPDKYGFLPFWPGNAGRNILDGPGTQNINISMLKNWNMAERRRVQLRWETFNLFNHPNFLLPNRNYNETAAGIISGVRDSGSGGPRIMQFGMRYEF
jgi:hypothetical protein